MSPEWVLAAFVVGLQLGVISGRYVWRWADRDKEPEPVSIADIQAMRRELEATFAAAKAARGGSK